MQVPVEDIIRLKDAAALERKKKRLAYSGNHLYEGCRNIGTSLSTCYANLVTRMMDDYKELQEEGFDLDRSMEAFLHSIGRFRDQIFVDLGAGHSSKGYEVACKVRVSAYIGVEPSNPRLGEIIAYAKGERDIPYATVDVDLLSFLEQLPQESVSLFVSGIDGCIMQDADYVRQASREATRVLHEEGVMFSNHSVISAEGLQPFDPFIRNVITSDKQFYSKKPFDTLGEVLYGREEGLEDGI